AAIAWVLAGGVAAAFLGPWNASLTNHWLTGLPNAAPYLIIALAALLASGLLLQLRLPDSTSTASAETERPLRLIVRQPTFVLALAAAAIAYAIMMLVMTATPLAMRARGFGMPEVALVMQWHVLGMFAPSFFSGILLARLGILRLLLLGCLLLAGCSLVALLGDSLGHFWLALVLLGIGWNFLFVGGSTLLTTVHRDSERGKVQGVNDLSIFSLVAIGSLLAGSLLHWLGWSGLNLAMLPLIAGLAVLTLWQAAGNRRLASA
ncbi:MAG: MFS transporter, partial [Halopseudomonas yangmingensis]